MKAQQLRERQLKTKKTFYGSNFYDLIIEECSKLVQEDPLTTKKYFPVLDYAVEVTPSEIVASNVPQPTIKAVDDALIQTIAKLHQEGFTTHFYNSKGIMSYGMHLVVNWS